MRDKLIERFINRFAGRKSAKVNEFTLTPREALGVLLVRTARIDGTYLDSEAAEIERLLGRYHQLNERQARDLRLRCETLESGLPATKDVVEALRKDTSPADRMAFLAAFWSVVYADGKKHDREDVLVERLEIMLGVDPAARGEIHTEVMGIAKRRYARTRQKGS